MKKPKIELGKYKHFKSDQKEYEVFDLVFDTDVDEWKVLYKALYDTSEYFGDENVIFSRSIEKFFGEVEKDGKMIKRFEKI